MEYAEAGRSRSSLGLATASITLAVLSVLCSLIIYLAVPLGALAILTGLLSRGDRKMFDRAKIAIVIASCAIIGSSSVTGYAFYRVSSDPALKKQVQELVDYYMELYGVTMPKTEAPSPTDQTPAPSQSDPYSSTPYSSDPSPSYPNWFKDWAYDWSREWTSPWQTGPSQEAPAQDTPEGGFSA